MAAIPNSQEESNDFEFAALSEAVNYREALTAEFAPFLLGNVIEIFLSSEKTGTKELHEQNCAPTAETSEATRATFDKTVAI